MIRHFARVIIKVKGHQYRWLAGGYNLEIGHFLEVANMAITWWIVAFLATLTSYEQYMRTL